MRDLLMRMRDLLTDPNADQFMANRLLRDIEKALQPRFVRGEFSGNNNGGSIEWEHPDTGARMSVWGQFDCDETGYYHEVCDEEGNVIYIVQTY